MSDLLDALGYAGSLLEKPGRAVRGLLAGRPDELAAVLPFSDTAGLTDESRRVTGHDLLRELGMDPGDGLGGTLAGVGVDVATDPLTYLGGTLARGLVRGGRGAAEAADSHVYDLVSAEERARDAANAAKVRRRLSAPGPPGGRGGGPGGRAGDRRRDPRPAGGPGGTSPTGRRSAT
jgi:hypothetical protein